MVFAKIGSAASVDAVFDDADAIDVEAADDRPARSARRKGGAGNAGLGKEEIAKLGGALAADLLVRHHRDGCKLVGHDGQHALLRRGSGRRRRGSPARARGCGRALYGRRALAYAPEQRAAAHDRARRRHGDFRQLRRGRWRGRILGHRAAAAAHSSSQLAPPRWKARLFGISLSRS